MAAASNYFSTCVPAGQDRPYTASGSPASGSLNMGTSSYASDPFELRITTGAANGPATIYKRDVENFLLLCQRWLNDQTQGLDYVIKTASTAGVP